MGSRGGESAMGTAKPRDGFGRLLAYLSAALLLWFAVDGLPNASATVLPTTISQDTTLTAANNPYTGSPMIEKGVTVNVGPGVRVIASGSTSQLIVKGTLQAEGTAEKPVVFNGPKEAEKWKGIKFEPGSGASVLDHVEVANGGYQGLTGGVEVNASSPTILNSTFRNNNAQGIKVPNGGSPNIGNNRLIENASPVAQTCHIQYTAPSGASGEINIHDNYVEKGGSGICVSVNSASSVLGKALSGNTVVGTGGTAVTYSGPDIPSDVTENSAENNATDEIQVAGTVGHSSTWKLGGAPVRFASTVIIPTGVTLNLQPGVYIFSPRLTVNGTVRAEGTAVRPVTLTGSGEEKGGEWTGINLEPSSGSSSLFNYVELAFGGAGVPMLNVRGASPAITNSTFRRSGSDGIRVQQSGQPIIEGNRFRNNKFGLRYEGEGKLAAPRNDWGCASGPKPTGCGDSVTSNVSWQPAVVLQELPRLCPGTTMLATSNTCLLQKYSPTLRLDSEENYLADDAAEITDNWGDEEGFQHQGALGGYTNVLQDGTMPISESAPWGFNSMFPLSLSVLGPNYPAAYGGAAADGDDWIDESNDYVRDAHLMEEAGYANAAYGRVITDGTGKRWLQYWYWYYYNPKSFSGIGTHEGDWEAVLVGLDSNNRPLEVIFSQHESPSNCYIGDVELNEEGGPVVYVALDSHANYRKAGVFDGGVVTDYVDGGGPLVQPGLIDLGSSPPSWLSWPGHWGNSRGGGLNSESPDGPAFHGAWIDPAGYASGADECSRTLEEETEESFEMRTSETTDISAVTLQGRQPQVEYKVAGADGEGFWPRLRISVNELGDGGIPPVSKTISNVKARGRMALPVRVKPGKTAEVLGSIVYESGRRLHLTPRTVRSSP
jgi:parallel beta-helix repeat protein